MQKLLLKNGPSTTTLQEILIEEKMSKIRYAIRFWVNYYKLKTDI